MSNGCEHYWNYEHAVYDATSDKCMTRRWCSICGLMQHSYTGAWHKSFVGPDKMFDEYPEGYDLELIKEPTQ